MAVASSVSAVLAGLNAVRGWQEDFYRDLHRHPELSHQERRTAAKVCERLGRAGGYQVHHGVGGTGVVGVLNSGDGPTVLLRADMDALPVREATGLPYASTVAIADASVTTPTMSSRAARTAVSAPLSPNAKVPVKSNASSSGGSAFTWHAYRPGASLLKVAPGW